MRHFRRQKLFIALHELYLDNLKQITPETKYHRVEFLLKSYSSVRNKLTKQYELDNPTVTNQLSLF